jgi:hypothetical protein
MLPTTVFGPHSERRCSAVADTPSICSGIPAGGTAGLLHTDAMG